MKPAGQFVCIVALVIPLLCGVSAGEGRAQQSTAQSGFANPWPNVFKSPQGFSISYPNGWMLASKDQEAAAQQKVQPYLRNMGNVDLSRYAVMVFDPASGGGFSDNLNVTMIPQSLSVNSITEAQMRSQVSRLGQSAGSTPANVNVDSEDVGGRLGLVARFDVTMAGKPLSMTEVALPDGNRTVMVTYGCLQNRSAQESPVFQAMVDSVGASLPPDTTLSANQPPSTSASSTLPPSPSPASKLPPWAIGAIVGGLVGLFGFIFSTLSKGRNRGAAEYPVPGYASQPWKQAGGSQQSLAYPEPWSAQQSSTAYQPSFVTPPQSSDAHQEPASPPPPSGLQHSPEPLPEPPGTSAEQPPETPPRKRSWPPEQPPTGFK